jgi:hypothetical protein
VLKSAGVVRLLFDGRHSSTKTYIKSASNWGKKLTKSSQDSTKKNPTKTVLQELLHEFFPVDFENASTHIDTAFVLSATLSPD